MDASTFDHLARTLVTCGSRRTALGALFAAGVALGLAGTHRATAQLACSLKANGQRCSDGSECCSGRCHRRRRTGPKVCRQAGGQGICTIEQDGCATGAMVCGPGIGSNRCICLVTTRGRSFCGVLPVSNTCGCTSNTECEQSAAKGTKCVQLGAQCAGICPGGTTICMTPCPNPDPVP